LKTLILATALGGVVNTQRDYCLKKSDGTCTGGIKLNAVTMAATRYTGWIYTDGSDDIVFLIEHTNNAATDVQMVCWSALDNSGANGTGYKVPFWTSTGSGAAPVVSGGQANWTWAVSGDDDFAVVLANAPGPWINCAFSGTSGGASDLLTVKVHGVSP